MNKFIVATDKMTPEQQNAITEFIRGQDWQFWHWYENLWFVVVPHPAWSPFILSSELEKLPAIGISRVMVIQVSDPVAFWGRAEGESWPWMLQQWGQAK